MAIGMHIYKHCFPFSDHSFPKISCALNGPKMTNEYYKIKGDDGFFIIISVTVNIVILL